MRENRVRGGFFRVVCGRDGESGVVEPRRGLGTNEGLSGGRRTVQADCIIDITALDGDFADSVEPISETSIDEQKTEADTTGRVVQSESIDASFVKYGYSGQ